MSGRHYMGWLMVTVQFFASLLVGMQGIAMSVSMSVCVSVCLFVREHNVNERRPN